MTTIPEPERKARIAPLDKYLLSRWHKPRKRKEDTIYPDFNRRMMAATLDSIVLMLLTPVFDTLAPINREAVGPLNPPSGFTQGLAYLFVKYFGNETFRESWINNFMLQFATYMAYCAIFWFFFCATPGKMILKMKIVQTGTHKPINPLQILLRQCGYIISTTFFLLGFFWIGLNRRHRAWHDYLADTVVITVPWKNTFQKAQIPPPLPEEATAS